MPHGFSRSLHAGWFTLVDKAARLTTKISGWFLDGTLALSREAQRSRRIASGLDPAGIRRRALASLLWRRKFAVAAVGCCLAAIALLIFDRDDWVGMAVVAVAIVVFCGLEIDDLRKERQ